MDPSPFSDPSFIQAMFHPTLMANLANIYRPLSFSKREGYCESLNIHYKKKLISVLLLSSRDMFKYKSCTN